MNNSDGVTGIILNWGDPDSVLQNVQDLRNQTYEEFDFVVVDNGTPDRAEVETLEKHINSDRLLLLDENHGFAGGMNEAIKSRPTSKYYLLMNDDIRIPQTIVSELVDCAQTHDAGIVSPVILDSRDGSTWFEAGSISRYSADAGHVETEFRDGVTTTEYVPLCCALINRDVIEDVGTLSEEYFLYMEDVEFAIRTRRAGHKLLTTDEVTIEHEVSDSSGGILGTLFSYYRTRNAVFLTDDHPDYFAATFWPLHLLWVVQHFVARIIFRRWESAVALLRGLFDGVLRNQGRGPYP